MADSIIKQFQEIMQSVTVFKMGFQFTCPLQIYLFLALKAKCFEDGRPLLCCCHAELPQPSPTCCRGPKITHLPLGGCAGGLVVYSLAIKPKTIAECQPGKSWEALCYCPLMMIELLARLQQRLCDLGAKHQFEIQNGCAWIDVFFSSLPPSNMTTFKR